MATHDGKVIIFLITPVSVTAERDLVPGSPSSTEGRRVNGLYRPIVASAGTACTGTLEVMTPDGTLQVPVSLDGDPGDPDNPGGPGQPAPRPSPSPDEPTPPADAEPGTPAG